MSCTKLPFWTMWYKISFLTTWYLAVTISNFRKCYITSSIVSHLVSFCWSSVLVWLELILEINLRSLMSKKTLNFQSFVDKWFKFQWQLLNNTLVILICCILWPEWLLNDRSKYIYLLMFPDHLHQSQRSLRHRKSEASLS